MTVNTSASGALMPVRGFSRRTHPAVPLEIWASHHGLLVTSQLADMYLPGTNDTETGPTWLVSISHRGHRATDAHLLHVVDCFAMPAYDEDNHHPGNTRALFCPVDERYRSACECKLTEAVIVDPTDGYTWTTPTEGPCRGCDLTAYLRTIGVDRPCPLHPQPT